MSYGKIRLFKMVHTRIRNSKGYLINVNPYSENIYKSTIIYKIVNVFLYSDFLWIR